MEEITAMRLGVCYYPEQWPEARWADDARRMSEMGLTRVRIGEFAWSRIEPEAGRYDWVWLDRAVETLHAAGLGIIMGTPTATPPKWLVDQMPDMVAIDSDGRPRKFGSRRHYCFSHPGYHAEAARIVSAMAERYGAHPSIVAWQADNEYGCHDSVISYSAAAAAEFRRWLADKYASVDALNTAWGTVFWSQEYQRFGEIDPPNLTVTEPNPAHVLDYRRFASDEVVRFNRMQVDILRAASPGRDMVHNFMGFFNDFDHHAVSRDLDVATWDSYPLGFLEQFWFPEADKLRYARQGHPDIAAFHHDLYRGCSQDGRWWVMEQQPGPVNWARFNPAPLPGMIRLWSLEAMAHAAELVSYFRWRQATFAQEQMHSGLLRPDSSEDVGAGEARQVSQDIGQIGDVGPPEKTVALLYSYEGEWVCRTQPQGVSFRYPELAFSFYTALRRLGLSVDIVAPDADLSAYKMVVAPSLPILSAEMVAKLAALTCPVLLGPRSGSKTPDFAIPENLAPGPLQSVLPIRVVRVESLRDGLSIAGDGFEVARWIEHIEGDITPEISTSDGRGVVYARDALRYLAAWPDANLLARLLGTMAGEAGVTVMPLPADLRIRSAGNHRFAFNYGPDPVDLVDVLTGADGHAYLIGSSILPPAGVAVWREGSEV
jgi:beta-galactosidase